MKTKTTLALCAILLSGGGNQQAFAEETKPAPERVLAAPTIPDSFDDRSWHNGELETDLGPAKFEDIYAKRGDMNLTLRRFKVPPKTWEIKTPKEMLDGARDNMLRGDKEAKLKSEKDFEVDGFPGRSFVFIREANKTALRMDYFLLKPDVFIYVYSGPEKGLESEDVAKFFKGIKTMEAKPKKKEDEKPEPKKPKPAKPGA